MRMLVDEIKVDVEAMGIKIRELMILNHHSVEDFANGTGLSKSAIRNYINGKNPPSLQNIGVISKFYHVSVADI